MREIKSYIVNKRKRELTFSLSDGSSHYFVFQYGTIQDFTYILRACLKTKRYELIIFYETYSFFSIVYALFVKLR